MNKIKEKNNSKSFLEKNKIKVKTLNKAMEHQRIGDWDLWGKTGKYLNRKTGQTGRGVKNLLILLKREK